MEGRGGAVLLDLEKENNMAAVELEWIPETLYNTALVQPMSDAS